MRQRVGVDMHWLTTVAPQYDSFVTIPPGQHAAARVCRRLYAAIVLQAVINEVRPGGAFSHVCFCGVEAHEGGQGILCQQPSAWRFATFLGL